jgi:hypothetical protein
MTTELDFSSYFRPPPMDVPGAVALGHALLSAAPATAPEPVKAAAQGMRGALVALQKVWATALPPKAEDPRPLDTRYDGAWSALRERLVAVSSLGDSEPELVERAERILGVLFPDGADFLKQPYVKQWAEAEKRIALVNSEGLRADIDRLAGAPFWAQVESLHQSYGQLLGITKPKEAPTPAANVLEALRVAQRAIGAYQLQLVAAAMHDPAFVPAATRALAPIDAARAAARRARGQAEPDLPAEPDVTPDTPLPELPAS